MSSKRHHRRRSCEHKVAYFTKDAARFAAYRLRDIHGGGSWVPYRCAFSSHWHVGRRKKQAR